MIDRIAKRAFQIGAAVFAVAFFAMLIEAMEEPIMFILAGIFAALSYLSAKAGGMDVE